MAALRRRSPPKTKVTIVGRNESYHRENLLGPLLVHKLLGPPLLPPPLYYFAATGPSRTPRPSVLQYRQQLLEPPKPQRHRAKGSIGRKATTSAEHAPNAKAPVNKTKEGYRQKLSALHQKRERLAQQEMRRLQEEEALHQDYLGVGDVLRDPPEEPPQPQGSRPGATHAPVPETCTIQDVEQYLQEHRNAELPLSKRVLNTARQPGDKVEVLPVKLALLLKQHQLQGASPPPPALPLA